MKITKRIRSVAVAVVVALGVILGAIVLSACGSSGGSGGDQAATGSAAVGNGVDRAFVADMIPHHESAVEMADIAQKRAQSDFVRQLAASITKSQSAEISTMKGIAAQLEEAGVKPTDLGVPQHAMGMDMDLSMLRTGNPFDRMFIDMMIPHHQGAIVMARAALSKGQNTKVKQLANKIIADQSREIRAMNTYRMEAFGAPSPAGGIPKMSGGGMDSGSGGHGGM